MTAASCSHTGRRAKSGTGNIGCNNQCLNSEGLHLHASFSPSNLYEKQAGKFAQVCIKNLIGGHNSGWSRKAIYFVTTYPQTPS